MSNTRLTTPGAPPPAAPFNEMTALKGLQEHLTIHACGESRSFAAQDVHDIAAGNTTLGEALQAKLKELFERKKTSFVLRIEEGNVTMWNKLEFDGENGLDVVLTGAFWASKPSPLTTVKLNGNNIKIFAGNQDKKVCICIQDLQLTGGKADSAGKMKKNGGAVMFAGQDMQRQKVKIFRSHIKGCQADYGGAIMVNKASLEVVSCVLSGNKAVYKGKVKKNITKINYL